MDEEPQNDARDVVYVGGQTEQGDYHVLRCRDDHVEVGQLRNLREGQPIVGELVRLTTTEEHERLFDVEVLMEAQEGERRCNGPAQVATAAYRAGWDKIFN